MRDAIDETIDETEERHNKQRVWNEAHAITPISMKRQIGKVLESVFEQDYVTVAPVKDAGIAEFVGKDLKAAIADLEKRMRGAAADLEFEEAARLRDEIRRWRRSISGWNRRRRRVRRYGLAPRRAGSGIARRNRWGRVAGATIRTSGAGGEECGGAGHNAATAPPAGDESLNL